MKGPKAGSTFFSGGYLDAWMLYYVLAKPARDPSTGIYCCECACVSYDWRGYLSLVPSSRVPVSVLRGSVRVG